MAGLCVTQPTTAPVPALAQWPGTAMIRGQPEMPRSVHGAATADTHMKPFAMRVRYVFVRGMHSTVLLYHAICPCGNTPSVRHLVLKLRRMASEQQQQHTSEYLERVFLEDLHVCEEYDNQGFRLILRPTYRPQGNTQAPRVTLETAAEYLRAFTLLADLPESSPKYASYPQNVFKVVGVAQNASGIKFSMRIKVSGEQGGCEISCDFFCDPTNDDVLFRTNSWIPIEISSIREVVTEQQLNSSVDF